VADTLAQSPPLDLTLEGTVGGWTYTPTWIASPPALQYGNFAILRNKYAYALDDRIDLSRSAGMCYVKLAAGEAVNGRICGYGPGIGVTVTHALGFSAGIPGITVDQAGVGAPQVTVSGTTALVAGQEFSLGWAHDGQTLLLYVNGGVVNSATCIGAQIPNTGSRYFFVGAEGPQPSGVGAPVNVQIGRFFLAKDGLSPTDMADLHALLKQRYTNLP
jgi:hypothetical protein